MRKYCHNFLVVFGLISFMIQHAAVVILMRYGTVGDGPRPIKTTIVLLQEYAKLSIATIMAMYEAESMQEVWYDFKRNFFPMMVPSLCYGVQNNLILISLSYLPASVFDVIYQIKLLTAAFFAVVLMKKKYSKLQWSTVFTLAVGIGVVKMSDTGSSGDNLVIPGMHDALLGFITVISAAMCSGFAGAWFQRILVAQTNTKSVSLWIRNIQMAVGGLAMSMLILYKDFVSIGERGFFYGYTNVTWWIIILNSGGGILISLIIKRAGVVAKGFAAGLSIILTCIVSVILSSVTPSLGFICGTAIVIVSVMVFSISKTWKTQETAPPAAVPLKTVVTERKDVASLGNQKKVRFS